MSYPGNVYFQPPSFTTLKGASVPASFALTRVGQAITMYSATNISNSDNFGGGYIAAPATPYCAIANLVLNQGDYVNTSYTHSPTVLTCFGFYDGTKLVTLCPVYNNGDTMGIDVYEWSGTSAIASGVFGQRFASGQPSTMMNWQMIQDDGTNIKFYMAMDGTNNVQPSQWVLLYSQSRTAYLSAPTNICWGMDVTSAGNTSASPPVYCTLNSFQTVAL